ncbi:MAG: hypothetical protein QOE83_609 [Actinomycetota bacterium]|jgi:hypothetical protein|nr:hypothetical protein [Actinomycetota bacterium]
MPPAPSAPTAERLASQLLSGPPAADAVAVAKHLLAIQGQDIRGARLAVRARTRGLSAADVDRALNEGLLLITWLNRGTLHLVRTEDYPLLQALTTPQLLTGNARRLAQEGVSVEAADRGVAVIERSLTEEGPLTRNQLRDRLDSADVPTQGQALVHLLMLSSLRGIAVRGPVAGSDHAFVSVRDWVGASATVGRPAALAELARRFLVGHGPADDRDLAKWAGITLRDARAGLSAVADTMHERPGGLLAISEVTTPQPKLPPPRLLGQFDPLLLGWVSREPIVGSHATIVTNNGLFRPFALVRGRAVGTWSMKKGRVVLATFAPLKRADANALESDAADVERFLSRT